MVKRAVPNEGRRRAINSKITNDVRASLEMAALKSGRTLSLEIETRLQASIDRDAEAGHESAQVGSLVVAALMVAEKRIGRPWHSDKASASYCYDRIKDALAMAMAVEVEMPGNKLQQAADPDVTAARALAAHDNRAAAAAAPSLSDEARAPWEAATRPATTDEIAGMVPAQGQLTPEIGDRALFDDAVSGLPLIKAQKAAEKSVPETAPARRKARAKTETEA